MSKTIYHLSVANRDGRKTYDLPIWAILHFFSALKRADRKFSWKRREQDIFVKLEGSRYA